MRRAAMLFAGCWMASAGSAMAGDSYWDYRLGLGGEPALTKAEYDPNGSPSYDASWDAPGGSLQFDVAHRFAARTPHSAYVTFGGFVRGFGGSDDPDTGDEISLGVVGIQGGGGYSFRPNARYSLEVGPRLGIGFASATETIAGGDIDSDTGGYARIDVGVSNLFDFGRFQLGATLGVASWAATVRYPGQDVYRPGTGWMYDPGGDATYSGAGGYLLVSAGFR